MFTGIISSIGTIIESGGGGDLRIVVSCGFLPAAGESVCVNGACLTALDGFSDKTGFAATLSHETLSRTSPRWSVGEKVNLERSLKVGDFLSGHIVTGHIDGTATIERIEPSGDSYNVTLNVASSLARFIAEKGSVCLDGISLTVNKVSDQKFSVTIIPHTWTHTTLSERKIGDALNIEVDLMARYVARLHEGAR